MKTLNNARTTILLCMFSALLMAAAIALTFAQVQ